MDASSSGPRIRNGVLYNPPSDDRPVTSSQIHDAAPAICRICRGEGTSAEPLFYPCKCSGSIKYVHQECLMEWLSHSQKKYCELCKTSFRFTKLYAPDMPQSLPVHVFLQHVAKYMLQNVLVWLRAALAFSVWIFWLPYFMRSVWSFMFWISDEGLGSGSILSRTNDTLTEAALLSSAFLDVGTCPASPLFAPTTTSAADAQAVLDGVSGQNISDFLIRILLASLGMPSRLGPSDVESEIAANVSAAHRSATSSSLLSEVEFLRTIARTPAIHRTLVAVLEGQLITILVIVCFILIILVRDYVVQQQPDANMRAAFPVADDAPPAPEQAAHANQPGLDEEDFVQIGDESDEETLDEGEDGRGSRHGDALAMPAEQNSDVEGLSANGDQGLIRDSDYVYGSSHPDQAAPQAITANQDTEDRASVVDYLRIYREASGDPDKIVEIAEREGLREKLNYWIEMTFKERERAGASRPSEPSLMQSSGQVRPMSRDSTEETSSSAGFTPTSSEQSQANGFEPSTAARTSKGKEADLSAPLRSRAVSDGSIRANTVNPLANSSWTFNALPQNLDADREADPWGNTGASSSGNVFSPPPEHAPVAPSFNEDNEFRDDLFQNDTEEVADTGFDNTPRPLDETTAPPVQVVEHGLAEERPAPEVPAGVLGHVAHFMWGNVDDHAAAEDENAGEAEILMEDDAHDDAWVDEPLAEADGVEADPVDELDGEAPPILDQEAVEDMEDFEGIMELIGMRGPIAGLFQNAIFCAVLVTVTIFACTFIPYNIGRVTLWILAHPIRLVRMIFELSKLVQDGVILVAGFCSWCLVNLIDMFTGLIGGSIAAGVVSLRKASWNLWVRAGTRVLSYLVDFPMSASEVQNFSAISHEALITVKDCIGGWFLTIKSVFLLIGGGSDSATDASLWAMLVSSAQAVETYGVALLSFLTNPSSWVIDLGARQTTLVIKPELAYWSSLDRFWAILAGYVTIFFLGAMYLKRNTPFSRPHSVVHAWEVVVIDTLQQASGIMKVILVISIEMLVFPLYCGLLLDAALLPLFEGATFKSRMLFTYNYPLTSVFVHWFVGTGYMFHFALFVSMCRKIMRPGVLYFIRDPDDPEFHPIRDVLERTLIIQLRKIMFSAFVYGALVIVCLGGVVWGLAYTITDVLPIHYSSNEPVLEFPVDLLFYNFLMPLAVKFFKPSDGLQIMYTWWFRKCARGLRLTYFLFGERRIDEEGILHLAPDSPHENRPWYQKFLLELNEKNDVIPKTWRDTFEGGDAKPNPPTTATEAKEQRDRKSKLVDSGELVKNGDFVRAPASDRIKIPKGKLVFLPVSERNRRKDGKADTDLYSSEQYQIVYMPPRFRLRIFLFILFIWMFAAVTGVGFTIVPLVFGRILFKGLLPEDIRTNDIYAFSIGIYVLGTAAYSLIHLKKLWARVQGWKLAVQRERAEGRAVGRAISACIRAAKLLYAYTFLLVVFPLLLAAVLEMYLLIPLNTHMNPPTAASIQAARDDTNKSGRHTIPVMQDWTLGLLYLKLGARAITYLLPESRPAAAVRAVLRRGWLRPNIGVLTRAFVVPGLFIAAVALLGPPSVTSILLKHGIFGTGEPVNEAAEAARIAIIYRQAYPVAVVCVLLLRNAVRLVNVFNGWTARIRDEAYLIGERLHNFGAATAGSRKGKTSAFRGRGARL